MGCDTVVVLGRATADGQTLFGQHSDGDTRHCQLPCRTASRSFTPGEKVFTKYLELAQARHIYTVLANRPAGSWGYDWGVNEHQVGAGCVALRPALRCDGPGLLGTDLVRLVLERSRTARQAADLLTDLVERYGQGTFANCPPEGERDNAFLIADPMEAYAVEAAGTHWVYQEIREVRVVSNVRIVRQDWDRISRGLAALAFSQGWWPEDGSKLDFSGALGENPREHEPALRRWGHATMLLLEQSGRIDTAFLRRILNEQTEEVPEERSALQAPHDARLRGVGSHDFGAVGTRSASDVEGSRESMTRTAEESPPQLSFPHSSLESRATAATTIIAQLRSERTRLPVVWWALGLPKIEIHFPLFLDGDLPASFMSGSAGPSSEDLWNRLRNLSEQMGRDPELSARARDRFASLQARFDRDAEEFATEGTALRQRASPAEFQRQAGLFMQYNVERLEEVLADALLLFPTAQAAACDAATRSGARSL